MTSNGVLFYFDFEEIDVVFVLNFFLFWFLCMGSNGLAIKKWFLGTLIYMVVRLMGQWILVCYAWCSMRRFWEFQKRLEEGNGMFDVGG